MNIVEWLEARTLTLAQMAATLEAGDRASRGEQSVEAVTSSPMYYAREAIALFDAVEQAGERTK